MTTVRGFGLLLGLLAGAAVVACWASSGTQPVRDAVAGARDPADFIRDYVTARVRLEDGRRAPPDGEAANDRGVRLGTPRVLLLGGPFHLHPPPGLLPVLAVAWLPWHAAARVWTILSLVAIAWLAWSLESIRTPERRPSPWRFGFVAALLVVWPPTLHGLEKGQWSIWLAALLAAGFHALERERPVRAGALFGVAASLKATPLILVGLLFARSRRAAATMLATVLALALIATAIDGLAPWRAFFADAPRDVAAWATWLANTASLEGVYARLWTVGPFTRPLFDAPGLARAAFTLTSAALVVAALVVGLRRRRAAAWPAGGDPFGACWAAAWLALPVLLNPLGWSHVVVMLLAPLAVALRDGRPRLRAVALVALAALSLPRQTLMAWAGPMPVPPIPGLVLGVHACAALALYLALLGAAPRPVATAPAPERRHGSRGVLLRSSSAPGRAYQ
jgi:hypothetical protein